METKQILIPVKTKDFEGQKVLEIIVNNLVSKDLFISLSLLQENKASLLELRFTNFNIFLKQIEGNFSECSLIDLKRNVFKGAISKNNLDYMMMFLLKYIKDGKGESNHIDVDFSCQNHGEVTISIKCEVFKELSEKELRKILK